MLASLASAAVHAFVVTVVVPTGLQPAKEDLDRLLPALYLIAPNRQPQAPREVQLIAIPLGNLPFAQPEKQLADDERDQLEDMRSQAQALCDSGNTDEGLELLSEAKGILGIE